VVDHGQPDLSKLQHSAGVAQVFVGDRDRALGSRVSEHRGGRIDAAGGVLELRVETCASVRSSADTVRPLGARSCNAPTRPRKWRPRCRPAARTSATREGTRRCGTRGRGLRIGELASGQKLRVAIAPTLTLSPSRTHEGPSRSNECALPPTARRSRGSGGYRSRPPGAAVRGRARAGGGALRARAGRLRRPRRRGGARTGSPGLRRSSRPGAARARWPPRYPRRSSRC
jgi:hypothetical protein